MNILNLKKMLLLLVSISFSFGAWGQSEKVKLNLLKAIEIALDNNPTVKVAELEIVKAQYIVKESQSALIPTAEANFNYGNNIKLPVMFLPDGTFGPGSGGAIEIGFANSLTAGLAVGLPLYMPTVYRNISLSREQLALSVENARASRINMVNEVKNSYYNIVLAENSLYVLLENKSVMEKTVSDIQNKLDQGVVSEYDLLTAKVQLINILPTIDRAEASLKIANYMLKVLLSLPQDIELDLIDDFIALKGINYREQEREAINLSGNSDLKVLGYNLKMQEHQYRISRASRIPTVFANFNIGSQTQSNDFKISDFEWANTALVGVGIKVPIFSGLKNRYRDIQIKNSISQTEISRKYMESNLNMQASNIISQINSAKSQIVTNTEAVKLAKKANEISVIRFNIGSGTILELNSSQVALMQAELSFNQSVYDLLVSLSSYDKLLGKEK